MAYCEDDCSNVVIEAGCSYGLLVCLRCTSLLGKDEAGANPNRAGAQHQRSGQRLTVEETACSNDLDVVACQWAFPAPAHLRHCWDQDCSGHVTCVSASLAALGADQVGANIEALLHVLGMPNHVHVEYASFVEALDDVYWGHANRADEELGTGIYNDGYEFVELSFRIIVAIRKGYSQHGH